MTATVRGIIGPINQGSSFLMVNIYQKDSKNPIPQILSIADNGYYYWAPIENDDQLNNAPHFTAIRQVQAGVTGPSQIYQVYQTSLGGIGLDKSGLLMNTGAAQSLLISNNTLQVWESPTLFLSNVVYTIYDTSGAQASIYPGPPDPNIISMEPAQVILIPITWFAGCTNSSYTPISTPSGSGGNWACMVNPNYGYCVNEFPTNGNPPFTIGYSTLRDCVNNLPYSYCPTGDYCGNANCNGRCQDRNDDCVFKADQFSCKFDPNKYIQNEKFWQQAWFWPVMATIIVVAIALIIVLIVIIRKHSEARREHQEDREDAKEEELIGLISK